MIKSLLRKTFLYKIYKDYKDKKHQERVNLVNNAFKREAVDVLRLYSDALFSKGIVFWLDFGTLLGYYREHDFIKHDYDIDTATWFSNHEKVKIALEQAGFELVRYYEILGRDGIEECYKHRDYATTIDVFYYFEEGNQTYCFSFCPLVPMTKKRHLNKWQKSSTRKWTYNSFELVSSEFKGIKVYVPKDTSSYLEAGYGKNFMTPIPDFPVEGRPNLTEYNYEEMPAKAFLKIGYM